MTRPISMLKKWIAPLHVCDFTEKLLHYRKIIRMPHRWMPSAVGVMPPPFAVNGRWQRYYLSFRERKLFDIGDPRKCPVSASREACGGWRACASAEHRPEDSPQLADPAGVLCSQSSSSRGTPCHCVCGPVRLC